MLAGIYSTMQLKSGKNVRLKKSQGVKKVSPTLHRLTNGFQETSSILTNKITEWLNQWNNWKY